MNLRPLPPESVVRSESHLYSTRYAHRPCANVTGVNDKNGQDVPGVSHDLVTPCPRSGHGRRWGFGRGFLSSGDDSQIKQVEKRTKKGTITGMGPGTKLEVFFYRTESGNEPVRDWLKGLDKQDRRTLGVKGCQMPAAWQRRRGVARVGGQASDKPRGRKPREKDAMLWGFEHVRVGGVGVVWCAAPAPWPNGTSQCATFLEERTPLSR